jgi:hypothetical protein
MINAIALKYVVAVRCETRYWLSLLLAADERDLEDLPQDIQNNVHDQLSKTGREAAIAMSSVLNALSNAREQLNIHASAEVCNRQLQARSDAYTLFGNSLDRVEDIRA